MKPCIACLIRPRVYPNSENSHFCGPCCAAWCDSPLHSTHQGLAEFALKRREEVLKPSPMVEPT